ncbi:homeobox transcription factor [Cavenderia fasciculata]|uniref:Homeobox transcription factor n=1 Tax=Cavenderia fasciculata TaxID=261658 RepID=F4PS64_CACFS|nr:homeobox transcription factor [Cavenderia fasciculata]EGG21447.1 homeobox transcription factor [Cavenderia fasciculata]|eukprot:XP_004359297.1 homeobox transcription factor [Cavenderia fasciculata]
MSSPHSHSPHLLSPHGHHSPHHHSPHHHSPHGHGTIHSPHHQIQQQHYNNLRQAQQQQQQHQQQQQQIQQQQQQHMNHHHHHHHDGSSSPPHSPASNSSTPTFPPEQGQPMISLNSPRDEKEKKRRTRLKKEQSTVLKSFFNRDCYPNKEEKESLANQLGMTYTAVTTWFSNKRQENRRKSTDGTGGRRVPVPEQLSPSSPNGLPSLNTSGGKLPTKLGDESTSLTPIMNSMNVKSKHQNHHHHHNHHHQNQPIESLQLSTSSPVSPREAITNNNNNIPPSDIHGLSILSQVAKGDIDSFNSTPSSSPRNHEFNQKRKATTNLEIKQHNQDDDEEVDEDDEDEEEEELENINNNHLKQLQQQDNNNNNINNGKQKFNYHQNTFSFLEEELNRLNKKYPQTTK